MGDFAENQLKKYGWIKGQGLGKNAEGRKTPIIITKKNDTRGLGDNSVDWSFEWWNKVYTNTLDNIKITKTSDGEVKISKMIKESTVPRNKMGIISTHESLYSLSDSSNSTESTFTTTFSSSDNESTRKSRFENSMFYYGNFIKSSTGPLDLNGWTESKSVDSNEKEKDSLCFATTSGNFDTSQDEEKQGERQKRKKSKRKKENVMTLF